jgi:hypothetical protein
MQKIEKRLREFIERQLSSVTKEWWKELVPEDFRKAVEDKIITSSRVLWFSEQPVSPVEYLTFPSDYTKILSFDKCWSQFEPTFHSKAILTGRLEGLGHIRHKIAHYRKVSNDERAMFEKTINWLQTCLTQAINQSPKQLPMSLDCKTSSLNNG